MGSHRDGTMMKMRNRKITAREKKRIETEKERQRQREH